MFGLCLHMTSLNAVQPHDALSGRSAARKQQFAELAFFSRARSTGQMGEVVDKLKANLRCVSAKRPVVSAQVTLRIQLSWLHLTCTPLTTKSLKLCASAGCLQGFAASVVELPCVLYASTSSCNAGKQSVRCWTK